MPVRVMRFGVIEPAVIREVRDEGRTLLVGSERFTLRPGNGHFVRDVEPSYGTRLILRRERSA